MLITRKYIQPLKILEIKSVTYTMVYILDKFIYTIQLFSFNYSTKYAQTQHATLISLLLLFIIIATFTQPLKDWGLKQHFLWEMRASYGLVRFAPPSWIHQKTFLTSSFLLMYTNSHNMRRLIPLHGRWHY